MMQPADSTTNRLERLKVVGAVVAVLFVALVAFSIYQAIVFRVVSTNPSTSSVATDTPFLKVNFNKSLSAQGLALTSSDSVIRSHQISGNTLVINLKYPMLPNKKYTITVTRVQSKSGAVLTNKQFSFSPQNIAASNLPADQQKAIIANQDHYSAAQRDPILADIPYSTIDFSLNPTFTTGKDGKQQLVLVAQLLLAPGVSGAEATNDEAQYKQEVIGYIQSLNLNPANYDIQYQVVHESLNGP